MKRIFVFLIAILLALTALTGALAETPLRQIYDSVFNLLFDTNNVTLTGHAEFSLDGERFKTADAKYIQDGTSSLWEWKLMTPRQDGSGREGGYTVIANGENVYVIEAFYPGVYKTGSTAESDTILRRSIQLNLLRDFLRILADQSDTLLGENAVQVVRNDSSGLEIRLQAGSDVPEMVNTALNMTVQFVAKRYFDTDYDRISEQFMGTMDNYITVTQGILGSTYYMALRKVDIIFKRDAGGNLESVNGNISIILNTENDGIRTLDIDFRLDVSDLGRSNVKEFDPADYGVTLADGSLREPQIKFPDQDSENMILETARSRWYLAGYNADDTMMGSVRIETSGEDQEDERIYVDFINEDHSAHWTYFTDSLGRMLGLQNLTGVWQGNYEDRHKGQYPDQKLIKETEEKLLSYLSEENPELSADVLSLETDWWYQNGDELYLHFWEGGEPVDHAWDEVDFIVRVAPEWRIEFFSCIGNG